MLAGLMKDNLFSERFRDFVPKILSIISPDYYGLMHTSAIAVCFTGIELVRREQMRDYRVLVDSR
jgi:hypothetical protein